MQSKIHTNEEEITPDKVGGEASSLLADLQQRVIAAKKKKEEIRLQYEQRTAEVDKYLAKVKSLIEGLKEVYLNEGGTEDIVDATLDNEDTIIGKEGQGGIEGVDSHKVLAVEKGEDNKDNDVISIESTSNTIIANASLTTRPRGYIRGLLIDAIRTSDELLSSDEVIDYFLTNNTEHNLSKKVIREGLKDARRSKGEYKIFGQYVYQKNHSIFMHAIAEFYTDSDNPSILKPEYEKKLEEKLKSKGWSLSQAKDKKVQLPLMNEWTKK